MSKVAEALVADPVVVVLALRELIKVLVTT
jgi:hypothetical protein